MIFKEFGEFFLMQSDALKRSYVELKIDQNCIPMSISVCYRRLKKYKYKYLKCPNRNCSFDR
jgi:hypothetical protein